MKKIITIAVAAVMALGVTAAPAQAATKYKRGTTFHAGALVQAGLPETATMNVKFKGKRVATNVAKFKAKRKGTYHFSVTYKPMDWSVYNEDCRVVSEVLTADRTVSGKDDTYSDGTPYYSGQIDTLYTITCTADVEDYRYVKNHVVWTFQKSVTNEVYAASKSSLLDENWYVVGDQYYGGADGYEAMPKITVPAKRIVR